MIVPKTKIDNTWQPDLTQVPNGYEVEGSRLNPDGETYTVTFTPEQEAALYISVAQCRSQLRRLGLLGAVETYMKNADGEEQDFWEYGTRFYRYSPTIEKLGAMLQIDLDEFWKEARKIHK